MLMDDILVQLRAHANAATLAQEEAEFVKRASFALMACWVASDVLRELAAPRAYVQKRMNK